MLHTPNVLTRVSPSSFAHIPGAPACSYWNEVLHDCLLACLPMQAQAFPQALAGAFAGAIAFAIFLPQALSLSQPLAFAIAFAQALSFPLSLSLPKALSLSWPFPQALQPQAPSASRV